MTDISEPGAFDLAGEAERLALITHEQVRLVHTQAELVETAFEARARQRGDVLIIDWSTGAAAVYHDNVIPFTRRPKAPRDR